MGVQKNINIQNKKARFEFEILNKFIAGIQLTGTEIKSIDLVKPELLKVFVSLMSVENCLLLICSSKNTCMVTITITSQQVKEDYSLIKGN